MKQDELASSLEAMTDAYCNLYRGMNQIGLNLIERGRLWSYSWHGVEQDQQYETEEAAFVAAFRDKYGQAEIANQEIEQLRNRGRAIHQAAVRMVEEVAKRYPNDQVLKTELDRLIQAILT